MSDLLALVGAVIAELRVHATAGDVVAAAWMRHFETDRRSLAIWAMAHQHDTTTTGRDR